MSQGPSVLRWSDSNFHLIDRQYKNIKAKLSLVAMMAISCQEGHFKDQNSHKLNLKYSLMMKAMRGINLEKLKV